MKNVLLASVAVAVFGLAGCASGDKMMKDDAMAKEAPATEPVTYQVPPAGETMVKEETMAADASADPMMDLCFSKGGTIGEWPGADENSGTKTCQADGNEYPLAYLTTYEPFQ